MTVRRPRTQRILTSRKETSIVMCGKGPNVGLNVDKIRGALTHKWEGAQSRCLGCYAAKLGT